MLETPKSHGDFLCQTSMDETMVNQQETALKKSWLAGIWDGEGSFSIIMSIKKGEHLYLQPKTTMENTSAIMVERCCDILDSLGITYYIYHRKHQNKNHRESYVLNITRMDMQIKFCEVLIPYLVEKQDRAQLLKMFVESRQTRAHNGKKIPYTQEELDSAEKIRELNKLGTADSSTTLRKRLDASLRLQKRWIVNREAKIKSDLYGDIQRPTEMIGLHA